MLRTVRLIGRGAICHVSLLALALVVSACDSIVEPVAPGTVEISVTMPEQHLVIDRRGYSLEVLGVSLALNPPALSHIGGADCAAGGCTLPDNASRIPPVVTLRATQSSRPTHEWAQWASASEAGTRLKLGIAPLEATYRSELSSGASVSITVAYMAHVTRTPIIFPIQLPVEAAWSQVLAGSDRWDTSGGRYELAVDPTAWLLDRDGLVRPLEQVSSSDPAVNGASDVGKAIIGSLLAQLEIREVR